jgi:hypothetical protein
MQNEFQAASEWEMRGIGYLPANIIQGIKVSGDLWDCRSDDGIVCRSLA